MRYASTVIAVLAIVSSSTTVAAQAKTDAWAAFLGDWRGPGVAMGRRATGDARWERVLGDRFVRLQMSFTPTGAPAPVFFGHAYYSMADSTGTWLDSQGTRYELKYQLRGDTLLVRYTLASGAKAESRYIRDASDTITERSAAQRNDGSWSEFLSYRFTRRSPTR